jgi:hypothetical protein
VVRRTRPGRARRPAVGRGRRPTAGRVRRPAVGRGRRRHAGSIRIGRIGVPNAGTACQPFGTRLLSTTSHGFGAYVTYGVVAPRTSVLFAVAPGAGPRLGPVVTSRLATLRQAIRPPGRLPVVRRIDGNLPSRSRLSAPHTRRTGRRLPPRLVHRVVGAEQRGEETRRRARDDEERDEPTHTAR